MFVGAFAIVAMAASVSAADARVPSLHGAQHAPRSPRVAARYAVPGSPTAFAIGSDGNPWYFGALGWQQGLAITKVDITTRQTTTYRWSPVPSCTYCTVQQGRVILNRDGNLYFVFEDDSGEPSLDDAIASVSPSAQFQNRGYGIFNTYILYFVSDITNGPDGNVWSIQGNYRCEGGSPSCWFAVPPTAMPANLAVPVPLNASTGVELATGADGDLWEADNGPYDAPGILHVDPATGKVYHHYTSGATGIVPGLQPYSVVAFIIAQAAGTVGYVDYNGRLHRHNVGGTITSSTMAVGGDGSLWFGAGLNLIRLGMNGGVSRVAATSAPKSVTAVTSDANGNIWFATTQPGKIVDPNEIGEVQV
jgi:hypothetical protein